MAYFFFQYHAITSEKVLSIFKSLVYHIENVCLESYNKTLQKWFSYTSFTCLLDNILLPEIKVS